MTYSKRAKIFLYYLHTLTILFICLMFSCSSNHKDKLPNSSNGTVSYSIQWPTSILRSNSTIITKAPINGNITCDELNVSTVEAVITDNSGNSLGSGSWLCSSHTGIIKNILEGSDRKIYITAKDSAGNILYNGEKTGITIIRGINNSIGAVQLNPVIIADIVSPSENITITEGQSVLFRGEVYGAGLAPYTYYWNFDGVAPSFSDSQNPENITFPNPGTYQVIFKVTDSNNLTSTASVNINVNPSPELKAIINVSPYIGEYIVCEPNHSIFFQVSAIGGDGTYSFYWSWSDGLNGIDINPYAKIFCNPGIYTMILSVQDSQSHQATTSIKVLVRKPLYVSTNGNDSSTGEDKVNPLKTIQKAISLAGGTQDVPIVIYLAAGTYYENIVLKPWVSLEGGWDSSFNQRCSRVVFGDANATTLNGNSIDNVKYFSPFRISIICSKI
jgi:hypothetical protein